MPLELSEETIERLRIPTRKIVDKNQEENRSSNQIRPPSGGFLMLVVRVSKMRDQNHIDQLKSDLHKAITSVIHTFEAETNETIKDIELVFYPLNTVDEPYKHLLNEIHVELVDKNDM